MLMIAAMQMWLVSAVSIQVLAHADHDDALFARLAISLLGSEWLSGYDFLTPVKEPVYPMWLAAVSSGPSAWPISPNRRHHGIRLNRSHFPNLGLTPGAVTRDL